VADGRQGGLAGLPGWSGLTRLAQGRRQSVVVRGAVDRVDGAALDRYLDGLGADGAVARQLDADADRALGSVRSLSSLTAPLAIDYLERLARPIPALTLEIGVQIVSRAYVAHLLVEADPVAFGGTEVPVLTTLPPLRRGSPPQDLLTRVVKASRRRFEDIRAVSTPAWEGFVRALTRRAHDQVPQPGPNGLVALEVVEGLARVGWVFRQVDLHYGLEPERE
jgi:hypothetical protein